MTRRRSHSAEIARIMLWSGLSNFALLAVFLAAQTGDVAGYLKQQAAAFGFEYPVAADDLPRKASLGLSLHFQQPADEASSGVKGPLRVTMVPEAAPAGQFSASSSTAENSAPGTEVSLSNHVSTEETLGLRVAPILRMNSATSKLEIGNFQPLALAGGSQECLDTGYSMLGDVKLSTDLLDIMVATDEITIAKICASNGSVMITCRNDQISVSPRRSRPDDNCQRDG